MVRTVKVNLLAFTSKNYNAVLIVLLSNIQSTQNIVEIKLFPSGAFYSDNFFLSKVVGCPRVGKQF